MVDREKVLTWLEICGKNNDCSGCCPYSENGFGEYGRCRESLMADAYNLLKEQDKSRLEIAHEMVSGSILMYQGQELVRCKDCKHRPIKPNDYENGFDLEFPDGKCPCQCDDGWYSWYPADNWFCADGEHK